jgi:hypothetical protein
MLHRLKDGRGKGKPWSAPYYSTLYYCVPAFAGVTALGFTELSFTAPGSVP